jgi:hypothetical protein
MAFVRYGLYVMRRLRRAGLAALAQKAEKTTLDVKTAGRLWEDADEPILYATADRDAAADALALAAHRECRGEWAQELPTIRPGAARRRGQRGARRDSHPLRHRVLLSTDGKNLRALVAAHGKSEADLFFPKIRRAKGSTPEPGGQAAPSNPAPPARP